MEMRLVTRYPLEKREYVSIVDIDSVDDLQKVVKSCMTTASATLNDVPIITRGQVELDMYNRPNAVIEYLKGIRKEL